MSYIAPLETPQLDFHCQRGLGKMRCVVPRPQQPRRWDSLRSYAGAAPVSCPGVLTQASAPGFSFLRKAVSLGYPDCASFAPVSFFVPAPSHDALQAISVKLSAMDRREPPHRGGRSAAADYRTMTN